MPVAVCEKCGADKAAPLETCQQCRAAVATDTERLHAFALSTYCMSQLQLQILQDDIRHHRRYSIPGTVLAEAQRVVTAQLGQAGRARVDIGQKSPKSGPAAAATKLRADAPTAPNWSATHSRYSVRPCATTVQSSLSWRKRGHSPVTKARSLPRVLR